MAEFIAQNIAFLGLGSNIGDRVKALKTAQGLIAGIEGVEVVSSSSIYETEPVGFADQPRFLNSALKIETTLSPEELILRLKEIEGKMGRVDTVRWGPRIIDIDILLFGDMAVETTVEKMKLTIPHPEMTVRAFVLVPLKEIAPDVIHPVLKKSVVELVDDLGDVRGVIKYRGGGN